MTKGLQTSAHSASPRYGWILIGGGLVGGAWRDSRYVLLIEPNWMLLGAAGLVRLVDLAIRPAAWRWVMSLALAGLFGWWMWPITANALTQEAEGYQAALEYVAAHLEPGEEYVIPSGDRLIDRWSSAELLNETERLVSVLQTAPRAWLISDSERLGRRYSEDFLGVIVQQFRKVYESQGVVVLLLEDWETVPPAVEEHRYDPPLSLGALALAGWERRETTAEGRVPMTFFWEKIGEITEQINTSMQIAAMDGAAVTQDDGPPARGMTTTEDFASVALPDPKAPNLPENPSPGRYRIDVIPYFTHDHELLTEHIAVDWLWLGQPPLLPSTIMNAPWREGVLLTGHDDLPADLQPGQELTLRLVWSATRPPDGDYTMFVHLLDDEDNIVAQSDRTPEGGFYPTSRWDVGGVVADSYILTLPDAMPQGRLRLVVGVYDPVTGQRALLENGDDSFEIAAW